MNTMQRHTKTKVIKIRFLIFLITSGFSCRAGSESTVLFSSLTRFLCYSPLRSPVRLPGWRPLKTSFKSTSIRRVPRSAAELRESFVQTAQELLCGRSRPCGSWKQLGHYKRVMRFQHNRKSQSALRSSHAPNVAGSLLLLQQRSSGADRGTFVTFVWLVCAPFTNAIAAAMSSVCSFPVN